MGRVKRQYRSECKEAFEAFKKDNPKIDIDSNTWRKILYEINKTFRDYIIETGEQVRLPWGFGDIFINKKKGKRFRYNKEGEKKITLPIDWPKTLKKGKVVYILNDHTDGYRFGYVFNSKNARIPFREHWRFKACRGASRLLCKKIKTPNSKYQYIYREKI